MNRKRLYEILNETTAQFRKGEEIEGSPGLVAAIKSGDMKDAPGGVAHIYAMPHQSEAKPTLEKVDMEFITIGVDRDRAASHRSELVEILNDYPSPERLRGGPSYIEVGGEIGDQGAAFQLFALGKVLGLWDVITPTSLGATGEEARELAGRGFIMISGYHP